MNVDILHASPDFTSAVLRIRVYAGICKHVRHVTNAGRRDTRHLNPGKHLGSPHLFASPEILRNLQICKLQIALLNIVQECSAGVVRGLVISKSFVSTPAPLTDSCECKWRTPPNTSPCHGSNPSWESDEEKLRGALEAPALVNITEDEKKVHDDNCASLRWRTFRDSDCDLKSILRIRCLFVVLKISCGTASH